MQTGKILHKSEMAGGFCVGTLCAKTLAEDIFMNDRKVPLKK
jgi:hypothetical protein